MGKRGYRLFEEIVKLSEADSFAKAVKEWDWTETYMIDEGSETCLCGHYPIKECCVITNRKTGAEVIVGNCCINKFIETESDLIFKAVRKVANDIKKSFNPATIKYVYGKRIITEWDYNFYMDIWRKRNLTEKQYNQKIRINKLILKNLRKSSEQIHSKKSIIMLQA